MLHLLYTFGIGIGGMIFITVVWVGVQQLVRHNTPNVPKDCDVLEGRVHGCESCDHSDKCSLHHP